MQVNTSMKSIARLLLVIALVAFFSLGCRDKAKASGKVDLGALEKTFGAADPASKEVLLKAVSEIKASDYTGALADLGKLNRSENLSPEQRHAVNTAVQQIVPLLPPPANPMAPMMPSRR
jgi:hypothetical protein